MIFLARLLLWLGIHKPTPVPPPTTPPTPALRAVGISTVPNATVKLDTVGEGVTNEDGYYCWKEVPVALGACHLWVTAQGYLPYDQHIDLQTTQTNQDIFVGVTRPGCSQPTDINLPALTFAVPNRRTQAELCYVLANFCNLRDSQNRVMFTAFLPNLPPQERQEWYDILREAKSTHVVICPLASYTGSPIPAFDWLNEPEKFVAIVREILATRAADGKAFTPILILDNGDAGFRARISAAWPRIRTLLGDDERDCIVVPGWELITASECTSADFSFALELLHSLGWTHIWAHLSPRRAACSSNPVEADDPWQGDEMGCWKSHGGQYVEGFLYQSEAIRPGEENCDVTKEECWLNRWDDVVPRIGKGLNGWRIMHLCYFEGPAYYYYRGQSDSAFAVRVADAAKALADSYGVRIGFGNGVASSVNPAK